MWELTGVNITAVEYWLGEGFEPFAVTVGANNFETIWLRKEKVKVETDSKPSRTVPRTSRRTVTKA